MTMTTTDLDKLEKDFRPRPRPTLAPAPAPAERQPHDAPHAGQLSSQVFHELTGQIVKDLRDTVEAQITDAANRRAHAKASMDRLGAEIDKVFAEFEKQVGQLQDKVSKIAEAVHKKVEEDTREMVGLGTRLMTFAETVNKAHDSFFNNSQA
jgi:ribosome-associated translation inhibitor RaiA